MVGDVVAEVGLRAAKERRQPDRLDAELLQIIEAVEHAREVADAVAVAVGERARVQVIDGRAPPPRRAAAVVLRLCCVGHPTSLETNFSNDQSWSVCNFSRQRL